MNWIIIDSDKERASKLKKIILEAFEIEASYIRFLDENSKPSIDSLYLIHNSDGYVDDFANRSKSLNDSFIVFYSGGGLSVSSLKANGASIGYYSGVFQNGDESGFKELLTKVKDVTDTHDDNKGEKFQKLFGYDPILEAKLNLLHQCLTKEGADKATDVEGYHLIKDDVEQVKVKDDGGNEKTEEIGVLEYLKAQSDPFDKNYINALTKLRDALLQDH